MKIGDKLAVQIEGMDVSEAVIEDISDGNAIIIIPATRLVVQVRQSLDLGATATPEVDRVFVGVEQEQATPAPEEAPVQPMTQVAPPTDAGRGIYTSPAQGDIGEGIHNKQLDSSALD